MREKRVSSKDVAKAAGVSQATVSYVLNNNQNVKLRPETRQLVIETVKELNYHTNCIARSMRLNKAASIGIVTSKNMSNYLFMNVLEGIKDALVSRNYTMSLCFSRNENITESEYIRYYHSKLIDGVIFAFADISDSEINYLSEHNIPYISIHANRGDDAPFQVKTNPETAIIDAIDFLKLKNITEIGYIGCTAGNMCTMRYQSFFSAMKKQCIPIADKFIIKIVAKDDELENEIKMKLNSLDKLPQALFCDSISSAFYMLRYANNMKIKIPEELSVIGIGTSSFSKKVFPSLSCIEAPLYKMGHCGSNILLNILDENVYDVKDIIVMDWSFVIRESC